jgi:hypothetical protein
MERETKIIEIEGHKFTVKTYATAKETNAIQSAYFKGSKVELVGDQPKISEFNPTVQYEVKLALIGQIVVDIDGVKENIVAKCEDLPDSIFQELTTQIDKLIAKKN